MKTERFIDFELSIEENKIYSTNKTLTIVIGSDLRSVKLNNKISLLNGEGDEVVYYDEINLLNIDTNYLDFLCEEYSMSKKIIIKILNDIILFNINKYNLA